MQEAAATTIVDFVRFADVLQYDLEDNPAVLGLEGHSKHGSLYTLLHQLLQGDVKVSLGCDSLTLNAWFTAVLADQRAVYSLHPAAVQHGVWAHVREHVCMQGLLQWIESEQSAPVLEACQVTAGDVLTKGRLMALLGLGAQGPPIPLDTVQVKI